MACNDFFHESIDYLCLAMFLSLRIPSYSLGSGGCPSSEGSLLRVSHGLQWEGRVLSSGCSTDCNWLGEEFNNTCAVIQPPGISLDSSAGDLTTAKR